MKYLDRKRKELKEGDYCFYTEKPIFDKADSLFQVVRIEEQLYFKVLVYISEAGYTKYEDKFPNPLELFIGSKGYMTEITLLKDIKEDTDLVKYMEHTFPLEN